MIIRCLLVLCLLTNVQISIQESNVANIYYQITKNKIPVQEIDYTIISSNGNQYQGTTKDSILYIENVPFGDYTLTIKQESYTYSFTINKQYLKTQHLLKQLEISRHSSIDTSDSSNISLYIFILGIVILLFFILLMNHN